LRGEAATHEREVLDKTRADALTAQADAQKSIAGETDSARAQLKPRAAEIARELASKLLGREIA
jgi:F0F1-type ATP synthase membrane subunit b/b'